METGERSSYAHSTSEIDFSVLIFGCDWSLRKKMKTLIEYHYGSWLAQAGFAAAY